MIERLSSTVGIVRAGPEEIRYLRDLAKREVDDVFLTERGLSREWFDPYLIQHHDLPIGYGLVEVETDYRMLVEFFLLPLYRPDARAAQDAFLQQLAVTHIEADSRRVFEALMLYDYCEQIAAHDVYFRDRFSTHYEFPGLTFRRVTDADCPDLFSVLQGPDGAPFEAESEEQLLNWIRSGSRWMLIDSGTIVGAGAIFEDFNKPYVEVGMMVAAPFRRRGYGTYILQELKKECYRRGLIPTSRCAWENIASRRSHDRAGFLPSGRQLVGVVKPR